MPRKKSSKQNKKIKKEIVPTKAVDPIAEAHRLAEKDIEADPDLTTKPEQGDDLDEGELARLEGED
ncbi:MAG: hypothetical protein ABJA71_10055 [Ginsengibacter sp.]